jgi:hypothetical protein
MKRKKCYYWINEKYIYKKLNNKTIKSTSSKPKKSEKWNIYFNSGSYIKNIPFILIKNNY